MIRRPPRSTLSSSSAASDVYKRQACEVHVWRPKREVSSSEAPLHRRQGEARAPRRAQEARTLRRGAKRPAHPQASLPRRTKQQCDSRVSSRQRRHSHVLKLRRESRVSESCVQAVQDEDASRPRSCEANLFDPLPMDLRDYLTKKRSANQTTSSCCCQWLISMLSECRCGSGVNQQSLVKTADPESPISQKKTLS